MMQPFDPVFDVPNLKSLEKYARGRIGSVMTQAAVTLLREFLVRSN